MRLWILLLAITQRGFVTCNADAELPDEPVDDSGIFYMEERSLGEPMQKSENSDIETRRRSALDKNFMRFGRNGNFMYDLDDVDYNEEYPRAERTVHKNDNFIRFGRGKAGDFIRFGRDMMRMTRNKDKNIIRFGRGVALKRNRRDVYGYDKEYKRQNGRNIVRFGRNDNFMRFGRTNAYDQNGPRENNTNDHYEHHIKDDEQPVEQLQGSRLLPLLTKIAAKLKANKQCNDLVQLH